ncbi:uncharacterized protein G6M90_00g097130 [Metarhizium brunneum]|uniref:Uncharacterized protein n=1 Tax=Metarhizium brunneum TaxID=500148 RepID=A0A7D5YZB7_9HYPO
MHALPIVDISFWNGCLDATLPVLDFISADVCTESAGELGNGTGIACRDCMVHGNGRITPLPSPLRGHMFTLTCMAQVKGIERQVDPFYCILERYKG